MAKEKGQKDVLLSFSFGHCFSCPSVPFFLAIVLLVLLSFSFGHYVACPSVLFLWPLCCLSFCPFLLVIVLLVRLSSYDGQKKKNRRTSNTMAKRKRTDGQATQ
jgi:hypothetical protein